MPDRHPYLTYLILCTAFLTATLRLGFQLLSFLFWHLISTPITYEYDTLYIFTGPLHYVLQNQLWHHIILILTSAISLSTLPPKSFTSSQ